MPYLSQYSEDAKDANTVSVLMVAVAADIGKVALVSAPQASETPSGLTANGLPAGTSHSQCSRLTMTARATWAPSGHRRTGRVTIGDQG
jgi:hypothetical protein